MGESHVSNCEDCPTAESDSCDRISELPDSLILSILSFLEMDDVVRTTFLSKRWKDLWTTIPCLDFDDVKRRFIQGALSKWKGDKIIKFNTFLCESDPLTTVMLDSWLLVPIEKQVEDLCVYLGTEMDDEYCAPQPLYSCSSITKLALSSINLKIEENVNVRWNHLKCLEIEHHSYLSEDALNRILSGAPVLEELRLLSLEISENLNIQSTSLKILKIGRYQSSVRTTVKAKAKLRIWAPNLLSLEISGYVSGSFLLDVPSLTNAVLCFEDVRVVDGEVTDEVLPPMKMFDHIFRSINRAEKVTLSDLSIQLLLYMEENDMAVQFSNTKFLKLYIYSVEAGGMLIHVLDMFPKLMTLIIELDEEYYYPSMYEMPDLDIFKSLASKATYPSPSLHQLKTVEISWCMYDASIFLAIEILLRNARLLDKMVFRPMFSYNHRYDRKLWLKEKNKVLRMIKSSSTAKVIVHKPSFGGTMT